MLRNEQFFLSCSKPHFNLRCPKGENPTMVYLIIKVKKQYKVSLGLKVIPTQWNKKEKRAMVSAMLSELDNRNNQKLNLKIMEYTNKFYSLINYLCNHVEEIDNPDNAISDIFEMKEKKKTEKIRAILTQGLLKKKMKEASFASYSAKLKEFCDWQEKHYPNLTVDGVNYKVMHDFFEYLHTQKVTHKILGTEEYVEDNTVNDKMGCVFTLFNNADIELDCVKKIKKEFENTKTYENQVFLDDDEIELLKNIKLKPKLDNVRNLFLFQLSIAQRWSDVEKILGIDLRDSIKDNKITTRQKKTNTLVTYPLDDLALSILEKYDYKLPTESSTYINVKIKEICKECGINAPCECYESRNRKEFVYTVEKWQLVGTHTARRTFISNAIKDGMDSALVMKISGHKTQAAFNRYNRVSQEDAADKYLANKASQKAGNTSVIASIPSTVQLPENSKLEDYRRVLTMFGVPSIEWMDIENEEELSRIMFRYEQRICKMINEDYRFLKELYNGSGTLKEKYLILNGIIKERLE